MRYPFQYNEEQIFIKIIVINRILQSIYFVEKRLSED